MVEVYSSRELREGEGKEIGMVLPFEVAAEDSQSLLSLTREMEHLLDPLNKLRTPPPSVDLSPLECHALQTEEVETLTAIYGSDLRTLNDQGTCFSVNVRFLSQDVVQDDDVIKIWFSLPASYPSVPPVFEIETNTSGSFNYRDADDLFDLLMRESVRRVGNIMIFDIVSIAQDYMPGLIETKREVGKRREKEERERMGRLQLEEALETRNKKTGVPGEIWDVLRPENQSAEKTEREEGDEEGDEIVAGRLPSGGGAVSDDVTFGPAHFVGSISNILSKFPDGLQIHRIENILRQDLARRFHRCRETMTSVLADSERKNPHMYDVQTHVAFHGTLTRSFPSIVERGLVIPGSGNSVKVRCGSSLGVGIYLSPSPTFSLSFTDSNRLIVCAALLGRVYRHGSIFTGRFHSSFNSLVCGEEWVFFNAAQVRGQLAPINYHLDLCFRLLVYTNIIVLELEMCVYTNKLQTGYNADTKHSGSQTPCDHVQ
jgi:hypothetical protein